MGELWKTYNGSDFRPGECMSGCTEGRNTIGKVLIEIAERYT